jgi:magnesium-protoporphyrin O-methyltransferase
MDSHSYLQRRSEIEAYFDNTAADTWKKLTSDAPLGRIRQTVRAGRDEMRSTLLGWLPDDLSGLRLLDAGCGTGAFAIQAAAKGAHVVATDLSKSLIDFAVKRVPANLRGRIDFVVGDMLHASHGRFDYVVAMDSLIHYSACDMVAALAELASKANRAVLFTFAPRTPVLAVMHAVGRAFPRADRAPAIEPISSFALDELLEADPAIAGWEVCRTKRIASGFYTSQAMELVSL